jgi:anti-sigma B factor antagonist
MFSGRLRSGGKMLDFSIDQSEGCIVCRPVGELDAFGASQFRQAMAELAFTGGLVLVDLTGVGFVDSAGLGALVGGVRRVREHGGNIAIVCPKPRLTQLLHTTGFDRFVSVYVSADEAATVFAQSANGSDGDETVHLPE